MMVSGRVAQECDRLAEDPVDGHPCGPRRDRFAGGHIPGRDALPRSDRHSDSHAQARVVGPLANFLHAARVEVERHPVVDVDHGDVANHLGEMLGGDVGAHGVGVGVLRRVPNAVGGQQDPAFEDEVCGMRGAGEPIQERFEGVSSQVLLRRCAGPALRGSRTSEDWIRRDTVSPELTPASPMFVRPGTSPAVGGWRSRSAGRVCRLGAATLAARHAPVRNRLRSGAGMYRRSSARVS